MRRAGAPLCVEGSPVLYRYTAVCQAAVAPMPCRHGLELVGVSASEPTGRLGGGALVHRNGAVASAQTCAALTFVRGRGRRAIVCGQSRVAAESVVASPRLLFYWCACLPSAQRQVRWQRGTRKVLWTMAPDLSPRSLFSVCSRADLAPISGAARMRWRVEPECRMEWSGVDVVVVTCRVLYSPGRA